MNIQINLRKCCFLVKFKELNGENVEWVDEVAYKKKIKEKRGRGWSGI